MDLFFKFSEILTDIHILHLSQRITNQNDLLTFGIDILDLPKYKVDSAITNHREIGSAVYDVLKTWFKAQHDRKQAYTVLYNSLRENKWDLLATELQKWAGSD